MDNILFYLSYFIYIYCWDGGLANAAAPRYGLGDGPGTALRAATGEPADALFPLCLGSCSGVELEMSVGLGVLVDVDLHTELGVTCGFG